MRSDVVPVSPSEHISYRQSPAVSYICESVTPDFVQSSCVKRLKNHRQEAKLSKTMSPNSENRSRTAH